MYHPFSKGFLIKYIILEPTPLEIAESLDMMRVLEHGLKVKIVPATHNTHAVDTLDDLKTVERLMQMGTHGIDSSFQ